eukprot:gnl/TRDRNA2_/TRDRNA2_188046_c0_seq1.p1 gnl/TRDRNA2_/TRDRNA2_188046_c0~~gnl/TRDRNA2_/TRDRNA2_188046_c0_seq1.p1  ORF type:complete len:345 (+),score=69.72 gnl/TRDRNA2_/TRDRNA2_188046_c0_seq1:79-1113(+)
MAWQAAYKDPLRWKDLRSSVEGCVTGEPHVEELDNTLSNVKYVVMHKPTHNPALDKSGQYPYSAQLAGKKRLWEIRIQVRFKQVPQNQLYFGVELNKFVSVSGIARQVQKTLVSSISSIVGDLYHSNGDDPAKTAGEVEMPTFVMPLWAFDQVDVSLPGAEPDITQSMDGKGIRRTDGVAPYVQEMKSIIGSFSTDKVYTFCFWGVSRFLDVLNWEVCGDLMPGMRLDFNKLCGAPPVFVTLYEVSGVTAADKRHLKSRKRYHFHLAAWSELKPPAAGALDVPVPDGDLASFCSQPYPDVAASQQSAPKAESVDLLGDMFSDTPPAQQPKKTGEAETVDLLGLM